jgi:plastocyanin domain-containing protein
VITSLSSGRYEPITVQKGIPVKWIIKAEEGSINGCNNSIVIPQYGMQKDLSIGDNIIEFTPTESGTVPFSCWMGMISSQITVVD